MKFTICSRHASNVPVTPGIGKARGIARPKTAGEIVVGLASEMWVFQEDGELFLSQDVKQRLVLDLPSIVDELLVDGVARTEWQSNAQGDNIASILQLQIDDRELPIGKRKPGPLFG